MTTALHEPTPLLTALAHGRRAVGLALRVHVGGALHAVAQAPAIADARLDGAAGGEHGLLRREAHRAPG